MEKANEQGMTYGELEIESQLKEMSNQELLSAIYVRGLDGDLLPRHYGVYAEALRRMESYTTTKEDV